MDPVFSNPPTTTGLAVSSCANSAPGASRATGSIRNPVMMSLFMAGLSMQVVDIEVGSVNGRVTARARAPRLEAQAAVGQVIRDRIHVALKAQKPLLAADQQHAVDASVRGVAGHAAFDLRGRVFEDKRSTFFDVAADAGLR